VGAYCFLSGFASQDLFLTPKSASAINIAARQAISARG
jgi:hypothetical protein